MYYKDWHKVNNIIGIKIKKKLIPRKINKVNLIFDSKTGIGNRIFGLMNAINWFTPDEISMFWDNKGWVSAKFFELFESEFDFKINEFNNKEETKKWKNSKNEITIVSPSCVYKTLEGESLSLKYNKIPYSTIEKYKGIYKKLKPTSKIREKIIKDKNYISLQVRNAPDWAEYNRNEPIEDFIREIEKYSPDTFFYLSAMTKETSNILKEKFKDRIIELENKDYNSMFDAIADLFNLANSKEAIYSNGSTFCELAWWLSNYTQKVTIIGSNDNWKK